MRRIAPGRIPTADLWAVGSQIPAGIPQALNALVPAEGWAGAIGISRPPRAGAAGDDCPVGGGWARRV